MTQINLDEDSLRDQIHINLIDIKEREATIGKKESLSIKFQNSIIYLKRKVKEYLHSLYTYIIDRYASLLKKVVIGAVIASRVLASLRSYIVTKIFWGRGSLYRYIALVAIMVPIGISVFIVYTSDHQPPKEKSLVITKAFINQTANSTSNFAVEGKIVETDTATQPTNSQGLVSWYTVKSGDTLDSIAKQYNINPDIISWANNLSTTDVHEGQVLNILPIQGIVYTIQNNDTISSISKYFAVSVSQIEDWNVFIDFTKPLPVGQKLFIQGADRIQPIIDTATLDISALQSVGCPDWDKWCYLQADPRWAGYILGGKGAQNINSWMNVKNIGCLITDVAMLAEYYYPEKGITPATIAYNPGYFVGGGLFTLSGLGIFNVSPIGGVWGTSWDAIDQQLALGHPVIVGISYKDHYVLIYKKENGIYYMNDPAYGGGLDFSKYYNPKYVSQAFLYTPTSK